MPVESEQELREILERTRTIAVLGMKDQVDQDAYRVPLYLQQQGYRIIPVNPKLREVLHERAFASLAQLTLPVDLVDVFRAREHLPAHVEEILAMWPRPSVVWFQLGIRDDASASRLESAGLKVVEDRCIMVDHRRLVSARRGSIPL